MKTLNTRTEIRNDKACAYSAVAKTDFIGQFFVGRSCATQDTPNPISTSAHASRATTISVASKPDSN